LVQQFAPKEGKLIDVGCGIGRLLVEIHKRCPGLKLTGADIDPECVRIAAENVELEQTIVVTPETDLGEEHRHEFDVMVCSHVLEHTFAPADFLKRHLELVKPGGVAVLLVPNPVRPDVIFGNITRKHYVNRGHVFTWDRSHWMNFLENILELEVITYSADFVPLGKLAKIPGVRSLESGLAKILPWFSFSNIAVVRV
jgi:2-polyprenyl-3-methyl-5-hydroxy-6-metoxy-1,4-benzoquinol methylase